MSEHAVKYHLKNQYLLIILLALIILLSVLLIGLCVGDPFYLQISPLDSSNDYEHCTSKHQMNVHIPLIISVRFCLLLLTTICAYKIRQLPDLFNETRQLVFTVYNLLFLSVTLPVIDIVMGRGKNVTMIVYGLCTFLICTLTSLIMFVPKIILVMRMGETKPRSSSTFVFDETTSPLAIQPNSNLSIISRAKCSA